jgi:hypothetical protein
VAQPLRVLLLDYNEPTEHDILLSHLCVERCSRAMGCPTSLLKEGVDYFSPDFIVFRPQYLGRSARFVVDAYKKRGIDFISISGHHASGFSGELGRGQFDTETLAGHLEDSVGAEAFFTSPSLVMLHGCRTDVKSKFDGDPIEYVVHVLDETTVRDDDFERLMAAVQQIGGVQQAYRDLFPNACLLGYKGTQTPGGLLEIFKQIDAILRGFEAQGRGEAMRASKFDLGKARAAGRGRRQIGLDIERECPRGWPCNLCRTDSAYYKPQAQALASLLRREQRRIKGSRKKRDSTTASQLESLFERAAFYNNSRWSCSVARPGTQPIWPDPVDESPFGKLFLELLLLEFESLGTNDRSTLQAELVHRLGAISFEEEHQLELRVWLATPQHADQLRAYLEREIFNLSTFRQRDLFAFFANIACTACLAEMLDPARPSLLRENAASQLQPHLGATLYLQALADHDPRVRLAAAGRLAPTVDKAVARKAIEHSDEAVRKLASQRLTPSVPRIPVDPNRELEPPPLP